MARSTGQPAKAAVNNSLRDRIRGERRKMQGGGGSWFRFSEDVDTKALRLIPREDDPDGYPFIPTISIFVKSMKSSVYSLRMYDRPCPIMDYLDALRAENPDEYENLTSFQSGEIGLRTEYNAYAIDPEDPGTAEDPKVLIVPFKTTMANQILNVVESPRAGFVVWDYIDGADFDVQKTKNAKRTDWSVVIARPVPLGEDDYIEAVRELVRKRPLKSRLRIDPDKYAEAYEEITGDRLDPRALDLAGVEGTGDDEEEAPPARAGRRGRGAPDSETPRGRARGAADAGEPEERGEADTRQPTARRRPGSTPEAPATRSRRAAAAPAQDADNADNADDGYNVGDEVIFDGNPATITRVKPNGKYLIAYKDEDGDDVSMMVTEDDLTPGAAPEPEPEAEPVAAPARTRGRTKVATPPEPDPEPADDNTGGGFSIDDVSVGDVVHYDMEGSTVASKVTSIDAKHAEIIVEDPDDPKADGLVLTEDEVLKIEKPAKKTARDAGKGTAPRARRAR